MNLFAKDEKPKAVDLPQCDMCGQFGFTGCDEAKLEDGRVYMALAWMYGTPCTCASGVWFRRSQNEWLGIMQPRIIERMPDDITERLAAISQRKALERAGTNKIES